ncbi:hypothetical protein GCM10023174_17870 [Chelativorans composti]
MDLKGLLAVEVVSGGIRIEAGYHLGKLLQRAAQALPVLLSKFRRLRHNNGSGAGDYQGDELNQSHGCL